VQFITKTDSKENSYVKIIAIKLLNITIQNSKLINRLRSIYRNN